MAIRESSEQDSGRLTIDLARDPSSKRVDYQLLKSFARVKVLCWIVASGPERHRTLA